MANKNRVAVIKTAKLAEFLGSDLAVMKSKREGARYPLYLSSKLGPIHLNTPAAQDFVLENGIFSDASGEAELHSPAVEPSGEAELHSPAVEQEKEERSFFDKFLTLDE